MISLTMHQTAFKRARAIPSENNALKDGVVGVRPFDGHPMETKLIRGVGADALLGAVSFLDQWQRLEAVCPWTTAFQSSRFVRVWYREYRSAFEPLLVVCRDNDGRLLGFLPLAISRRNSTVVPVGDYQAEYQGWICAPDLAESFPLAAFAALRQLFPGRTVTFRYLPPGIPLDWTALAEPDVLCVLRKHRRPLLRFGDGHEIENSLKKSGNKSRLRQLKKKGTIDFNRVENPMEFDALLAEIVRCHDARHLQAHGFAEFQREVCKRDFTRALMNEPGVLHISTLRVGGRLASVQLNYVNDKQVQLGLIAHDPAFSHFSPGKLHILFLARMLLHAGYEQIDLTPGGEEYKERFANCGDDVFGLIVYPTAARRSVGIASLAIRATAKRTVKTMRLNSTRLRAIIRRANRRYAPFHAVALWVGAIRTELHVRKKQS